MDTRKVKTKKGYEYFVTKNGKEEEINEVEYMKLVNTEVKKFKKPIVITEGMKKPVHKILVKEGYDYYMEPVVGPYKLGYVVYEEFGKKYLDIECGCKHHNKVWITSQTGVVKINCSKCGHQLEVDYKEEK